ncbi:GAF domain-containing protein [Sandaracinus amylolyticus]|uniref:histidine kinase n=1 Tax=Sandaracinus amylolyticus TaxID=927083 RepID=A0A0F6YGG4_9BACT|nr:GAF domain-containing protein [Sandaracinus amylolyticus]AKF03651.1 Phytochrome, two-component sensor histidine kinase [Sandaracinus amylolyticus]
MPPPTSLGASDADVLLRIGAELAREPDVTRVVQRVTDEATAAVGAQFGAFFYNVEDRRGESYMLYALSGVPREAFARFPMPRKTEIFAPTFDGVGPVRYDDVRKSGRFGRNPPHHGMPEGHLPVVSYLAVPVIARSDASVLGGLFFGHAEPGRFTERDERLCVAIAGHASFAIENARLFERLRRDEAKHRLVAEASTDGMWFWDLRDDAVEWNDRLFDIMGIRRDEWRGDFQSWFERVHPDDRAMVKRALEEHLARRAAYHVPRFRLRHADGEYRVCTTRGQAEWDANGEPIRMAGSFGDVTDVVRAQEALAQSEHRYRQILDSVRDMVFAQGPGSALTYANQATREHYQHDLAGAGRSVPDDRRVFEEGAVVEELQEANVGRDGSLRYFHVVKSPIVDQSGRVVELVAVARDVTAKKREEDDRRFLAEASALLASSIDVDATLSHVVRLAVPRFADWCAVDLLEEDGTIRRLAVAHVDAAKLELAHELHRRVPHDPSAVHGVPQVIRSSTSEVHAEISDDLLAALVPDPELLRILRELGLRSAIIVPLSAHGRAVGALTMVSAESGRVYDARAVALVEELGRRAAVAVENARLYESARAALEQRDAALAALQGLNADLEARVDQRTAALAEANRELEAFSYTVSHDLRAPIRHISGFADLLRAHAGDRLDDKGQRWLRTIGDASKQMGTLIDGLLSFSRMGRTELAREVVALGPVVRAVVDDLAPDYEGRRIQWSIDALPEVRADATMLRVVLTNLISNAVKYTRTRDPAHIEIGARESGGAVELFVRDDGVGFDMDYAHKLFGVFQRLHGVEEYEGTGIGLATVRRIVERHGGRTWAEGAPGRGATFHLTLPSASPPDAPTTGSRR